MKKTWVAVSVLSAMFALPAMACERPAGDVNIPSGASAGKEDMLAAKKAVDAFKASMEEYLACEKSVNKQQAAHAELVKVADRFNAEVKAFKAKG